MLGRLHVIPPLCSKVEMEFGTAQDSARDLAEHFGVWLKRGVKKNLLCVFHKDSEEVGGFSLDVKGAHKTSRVRERDRGLLGMRQQERLLFYRVCPFGACFSSHWFARIGGFLTRALHC